MSEPDDPSTKSGGGADRIEAMLADFRTAPIAPPVAAPAVEPGPVAPRRPRDEAVRPLWQAEGGRAAAPSSPWWQARPVWALVGLLVGIAGSQGWQALRLQEQRNLALASVSLQEPVLPPGAAAAQAPGTAQSLEARQAALRAAGQAPASNGSVSPIAQVAPAASLETAATAGPAGPAASTASTASASPGPPVIAGAPAARPVASPSPIATSPPRAKAAAPAAKPPTKADSPAARCKQRKGAEFQRCLQTQCRKDRYFAHRQCIALYERNTKP